MARSCGLRLGPRRFELVVLDGSAKKHRIAAFKAAEFPFDDEDPIGAAVKTLKAAVKEHSIPFDNVGLVVDSGMAAFRTIKLPFSEESKIEQVLKFEIESQLPQWNIDEVIVDFLPLEQIDKETNLLVTAVPKSDLGAVLTLCEAAGIEPLDAELETTAMVNAALAADIGHIDDAQVLVHIGDTSTSVVVMDAGQVRTMRAMHIGAHSWQPASRASAAQPEAQVGEDEGQGDEDSPQAELEPALAAQPELDAEHVRQKLQQVVTRLRRELGRTISAARTINEIEAIYVCGIELPELVGSPIMDVPVYVLDVFEEDGGQPAEGTAPLVAAYGSALRYLGGNYVRASLRREELRFTGTLEKIELPLAIAALLLVTWLSVFVIFEDYQHSRRSNDVTSWLMTSMNYVEGDRAAGDTAHAKYLYKLPELKDFMDTVRAEREPDEKGRVPRDSPSPLVRLDDLDFELSEEVMALRKDMGDAADVRQPQSALEGLTRMTELMSDLQEDIGRFIIRKVNSDYQSSRTGRDDVVRVTLDLTLFASSYSQAVSNFEVLQAAIREQGWEYEDPRYNPLEEGEGLFVDRFTVTMDLSAETEEA